jgi:hypothetical protein
LCDCLSVHKTTMVSRSQPGAGDGSVRDDGQQDHTRTNRDQVPHQQLEGVAPTPQASAAPTRRNLGPLPLFNSFALQGARVNESRDSWVQRCGACEDTPPSMLAAFHRFTSGPGG